MDYRAGDVNAALAWQLHDLKLAIRDNERFAIVKLRLCALMPGPGVTLFFGECELTVNVKTNQLRESGPCGRWGEMERVPVLFSARALDSAALRVR